MSEEIIGEAVDFGWRDLAADEVYEIGHLENRLRNLAHGALSARIDNQSADGLSMDDLGTLLENHAIRSESWFEDQLALKGIKKVAALQVTGLPRDSHEDSQPQIVRWLGEQLRHIKSTRGTTAAAIAEATGISPSHISGIRSGKNAAVSPKAVSRLASYFAEARGLKGKELDAFIHDALTKLDPGGLE
jgi:hypothetical protein